MTSACPHETSRKRDTMCRTEFSSFTTFEVGGPSTSITQAQKDRQKDSSHLHVESKTDKLRDRVTAITTGRGGGKAARELLIKGYNASVTCRKANSRALFYSMVPTVDKMLHC